MRQLSLKPNLLNSLLFLLIIFITACNNSGQSSRKSETPDQSQSSEKQSVSTEDEVMKRGQEVYNKVCMTCHQVNGSGVPMMFPPITESDFITGDHEKLIKLVLEGMSGPVEIKGEQYNGIMPPQNNLDDQQISDLLTYLRNSFGNQANPISAEEVARIRK